MDKATEALLAGVCDGLETLGLSYRRNEDGSITILPATAKQKVEA